MLYEVYIPNNAEIETLEINVEEQKVSYTDKTGKKVKRSDKSFLYKIKGIDEVILLGKTYPLKPSATDEVLSDYKEVLHLLGYDLDDLYLVVRYALYNYQLIEQLHVYSKSQKAYLPLHELKNAVDRQKEPLYKDGRFNPSFIMDLIELVDNKERKQYQLNIPISNISELSTHHILKSSIYERLEIVEEDGYHEGEITRGYKKILNLQPHANIGLLYNFKETGCLEIFSEKYRKLPTYANADKKYISQEFLSNNGRNLGIVKLYPTIEGYKFYHDQGKLLIEIFTSESKRKVLQDYALSFSHYVLESKLETV